MTRKIKIGDNLYEVDLSTENAVKIMLKIVKWMEEPSHYASSSGESLMQNDNTLIDSPSLIAEIVDEVLQPFFIEEVDETN